MSVSSVSSSSSAWELYANRQKSKAEQIDPAAIMMELEKLQGTPEELKAKAAEMYEKVTSMAEKASGKEAEMLGLLASDLATVAESGDMSALTEKMPPRPENGAPNGMERMSFAGIDGAKGASMKWIEAILAEDDDEEEEDSLSSPEDLLAKLQKLKESDNEKFLTTVTKLASEARAKAEKASGREAEMLNLMASDLEDAAATGELTAMESTLAGRQAPAMGNIRNISGINSSDSASMMWIQAQMATYAEKLSA